MKTTKKYHYVYRITNIVTEMYYYGDRSCNCHPLEDIGVEYFSTSTLKLFKQDQINNPQDYKYKIIKIFETCRADAKNLEVYLHARFDVKNHPKFINRANQSSNGFMFDCTGIKNSVETKLKKSIAMTGLIKSKEHCNNLSKSILKKYETDKTYRHRISQTVIEWHRHNENPFKGKKHTDKTKKLMSKNHADFTGENHPMYGKQHSDTTKKLMSVAKKGKGFKPDSSNFLLLTSPNNIEYLIYGSLSKFCKTHNLGEETIRRIYTKGIRPVRINNRNFGWDVRVMKRVKL